VNSPANFIADITSGESAHHPTDGEDGDANGPEEILEVVSDLLTMPISPALGDEVLNDSLGSIDDSSVETELEHAEDGRKYRVAQETCQPLQRKQREFGLVKHVGAIKRIFD